MERNFLSHILLVIPDQQFGQVRMLHLKEKIKLITFIYLDTFLSEKIVVKFKKSTNFIVKVLYHFLI